LASPAELIQRPICCRNDTAAEPELLVTSHGRKRSILKHLQELDLDGHGNVPDLIEEDRAVRGTPAEYTLVMLDRSGEGALFVPEKLRLDKGFCKLGKIYRNEIACKTLGKTALFLIIRDKARAPDCSGCRTLACPRFTEQKG